MGLIEGIIGVAALLNALALLVQSAKQKKDKTYLAAEVVAARGLALDAQAFVQEQAAHLHARCGHLEKECTHFARKRVSKKQREAQAAFLASAAMSKVP